MTNKHYSLVLLLILCIALFSCEKEIKLNLGKEDKMLVVNSIICSDSLVTVKVSYSQNILENQPTKYINNAKVLLFEDGKYLDSLVLINKGTYQSKFKPQINKQYSLEVSDGKLTATASCQIPEKAILDSLRPINTYDQFGNGFLGVDLYLKDNGDQKNYYKIFLWGKHVSAQGAGNVIFSYNDEALNNQTSALDAISNYINDDPRNYSRIDLVFSDKSFNGESREIELSELVIKKYWAYIHLQTLSEDYYKYLYSVKNKPNDTFSDPYPVHTNIQNGLGLFGAYNDVVDSVWNIQYPLSPNKKDVKTVEN